MSSGITFSPLCEIPGSESVFTCLFHRFFHLFVDLSRHFTFVSKLLILLYVLVEVFDRFLLLGFFSLNFSFTGSGLDFLVVVDEIDSLVESMELMVGTCYLISTASTSTWARCYKTFFMLNSVMNSVEHEISNAHKYKNIKKFCFFSLR